MFAGLLSEVAPPRQSALFTALSNYTGGRFRGTVLSAAMRSQRLFRAKPITGIISLNGSANLDYQGSDVTFQTFFREMTGGMVIMVILRNAVAVSSSENTVLSTLLSRCYVSRTSRDEMSCRNMIHVSLKRCVYPTGNISENACQRSLFLIMVQSMIRDEFYR
ncbi:hypothetical protein J6590_035472 [Homalodisca vitripennis]|nr:hypothetical protein J6590_035472 [Homalodisca vitripennis]